MAVQKQLLFHKHYFHGNIKTQHHYWIHVIISDHFKLPAIIPSNKTLSTTDYTKAPSNVFTTAQSHDLYQYYLSKSLETLLATHLRLNTWFNSLVSKYAEFLLLPTTKRLPTLPTCLPANRPLAPYFDIQPHSLRIRTRWTTNSPKAIQYFQQPSQNTTMLQTVRCVQQCSTTIVPPQDIWCDLVGCEFV